MCVWVFFLFVVVVLFGDVGCGSGVELGGECISKKTLLEFSHGFQ